MLFAKLKHETKKVSFTEFSESCRSKFASQNYGKRDHEGNRLLDDPKVEQQLRLHLDALALKLGARHKLEMTAGTKKDYFSTCSQKIVRAVEKTL